MAGLVLCPLVHSAYYDLCGKRSRNCSLLRLTLQYAFIVYSVIMNYYYPTSITALREEIERTLNRSATAMKMSEILDKHSSSEDWLGNLMEELGPFIQVQMADLANMLEVISNFYHFRCPRTTIHSLYFFSACFLLSAFTDAQFTLKVFWFLVGGAFFACWPISSLYPRYRLLVSPVKWVFWNIPTHAEWSFQYLQERSATARQAMLTKDTEEKDSSKPRHGAHIHLNDDTDSDESFISTRSCFMDETKDVMSFSCTYQASPGHLIISTTSLKFLSLVGKLITKESFDKAFSELEEMDKRTPTSSALGPIAKITTRMDRLELKFQGEEEGRVLENMRDRDKAFNAIIGFSGLRWQCLQKRPD